jgi:hypothetical protein
VAWRGLAGQGLFAARALLPHPMLMLAAQLHQGPAATRGKLAELFLCPGLMLTWSASRRVFPVAFRACGSRLFHVALLHGDL